MERDEVRVGDVGERPELVLEPLQRSRVEVAHGLERDVQVLPAVERLVDDAHPTFADLTDDRVAFAEPVSSPPLFCPHGRARYRNLRRRATADSGPRPGATAEGRHRHRHTVLGAHPVAEGERREEIGGRHEGAELGSARPLRRQPPSGAPKKNASQQPPSRSQEIGASGGVVHVPTST